MSNTVTENKTHSKKIEWKVTGMDCANCALTINKYLEKKGNKNVRVNYATGDVIFDAAANADEQQLTKDLHGLGYTVVTGAYDPHAGHNHPHGKSKWTHLRRFWVCLPFTLVLMLHMIPGVHIHFLMNPWIQLALCLPVFIVGMSFYGPSAWKSLRNGIPNMNVLIAIGATAAFVYSLVGTLFNLGAGYMYYETAATIITLVFLGNYMEDSTVQSTQKSLDALVKSQKVTANMIAFDDKYQEQIFAVDSDALRVGDLVLIKNGEQVPADCKILWGDAQVSEALLTGESEPIHKKAKDILVGGSLLIEGTVRAQVTAAGNETVLSNILNLVKQAQGEKPPVQQMADRISAIFVPVVLGIAALTFIGNWIYLKDITPALMNAIAVLVIACPCAMGLATPAAIAVGLGRGTRNGILFRHAKSLELFKDIKQVVFDKTGTLTTGNFSMAGWKLTGNIGEDEFKNIAFSIEKYSNHPIAKTIAADWKTATAIRWQKIEEIKGLGMQAQDMEGNTYTAGSYKAAAKLTNDDSHNVYIIRNNELLGWVDVTDELRPEAREVVSYLQNKGIKTILLSGDRQQKADDLARQVGITHVIAEQTPEQKLTYITAESAGTPTVMVGDGINDAPALAKATIGVSMSDSSQVAMQTASVVLMNNGLKNLPMALGLGKHTYITIKENLFWAFSYNIVAIPVAAFGLLGVYGPTYGALIMALSDVVLAINSARLFVKKVK
jgi:Cu+-exporting ATPase